MKKLITAIALATTIGTANAAPIPANNYHNAYHYGYHTGHRNGKNDAYDNVAKAAVIVGTVVIASVIIYELGRNSRWTTNQNGVGYRF